MNERMDNLASTSYVWKIWFFSERIH